MLQLPEEARWQKAVSPTSFLSNCIGDWPKVWPRPSEDIELCYHYPGAIRIEAKVALDRGGKIYPIPAAGRRRNMGDRNDIDQLRRSEVGTRENNRGGSVLETLPPAGIEVFRPQIRVRDDKARFGPGYGHRLGTH